MKLLTLALILLALVDSTFAAKDPWHAACEVFGLPRDQNCVYNLTKQQLNKKYRDSLKKYHPDKNKDHEAEEIYQKYQDAYAVSELKNMLKSMI